MGLPVLLLVLAVVILGLALYKERKCRELEHRFYERRLTEQVRGELGGGGDAARDRGSPD